MSEIQIENLLMAASARQGLTLSYIEAQTIVSTLRKDRYELVIDGKWNISYFQTYDQDSRTGNIVSDIRDVVELAVDINQEEINEKIGEAEDDYFLAIKKDEYILQSVMSRVENVVPPKVRIYKVGIVGTYKIYTNIEAASWSEAECIAKQNFADGKYEFDDTDFRGIMITSG